MKKRIAAFLLLTIICPFSSCSLINQTDTSEQENKQRYEQALQYLETGDTKQAYRLLYESKEYVLASQKLEELLLEDYTIQYRYAEVGDTVKFGRYEQDNHTDNGAEEIEWTVIEEKKGKLLLLSDYVLDCQKYYKAVAEKYYTWAESYACAWLNGEFLREAFLETERERICTTPITTYEDYLKANDTAYMKVFIISKDEYLSFEWKSCGRKSLENIRRSAYAAAKGREHDRTTNSFIFRDLYSLMRTDHGVSQCDKTNEYLKYQNIRPSVWISKDTEGEEE